MNLKNVKFNPTKDFKDFAKNFRDLLLQDDELISYVKNHRPKNDPNRNRDITDEEVVAALNNLSEDLKTKDYAGAVNTASNLESLAEVLGYLKTVYDNIDANEETQKNNPENTQTAMTAWEFAADKIYSMANMLTDAKLCLQRGSTGSGDENYGSIQGDPAAKMLLRCANLIDGSSMLQSELERKAMFSNFLYEDHTIAELGWQAENNFFASITDEEFDLMTESDETAYQNKSQALGREYNTLILQLSNSNKWFELDRTAATQLDEYKQSEAIQKLYQERIAKKVAENTDSKIKAYEQKLRDQKVKDESYNISIENKNIIVDKRQRAYDEAKKSYDDTVSRMQSAIPTQQSYEDALAEFDKENGTKPNNEALISLAKQAATREQNNIDYLEKAIAFTQLLPTQSLPPDAEWQLETIQAQRNALKLVQDIHDSTIAVPGIRGAKPLNLNIDEKTKKAALKDWSGVQSLYKKRDNEINLILKNYSESLEKLRNSSLGGQELSDKKSQLVNDTRDKINACKANYTDSIMVKESEYSKKYGETGVILRALAECERLFPDQSFVGTGKNKTSLFTPDRIFGKNTGKSGRIAELQNFWNAAESEYNNLKLDYKSHFEMREFLSSKQFEKYRNKDLREELGKAIQSLEEANNRITENENKSIEWEQKHTQFLEKIQSYPHKADIAAKKQELEEYIKTNTPLLEQQKAAIGKKLKNRPVISEEALVAEVKKYRETVQTEETDRIKNTVIKDMEKEVRTDFINNTPYYKEFTERANKRKREIDAARTRAEKFRNDYEHSDVANYHRAALERVEQENQMQEAWAAQYNKPNTYPDEIKARLEKLCQDIDLGRKAGHPDSEYFQNMSNALRKATQFLTGSNGEGAYYTEAQAAQNMENLRKNDPATIAQFNELLDNMSSFASTYHNVRTHGIHWFPSNMHFVRLDFAKELIGCAKQTKDGLAAVSQMEAERKQRCQEALLAAKQRNVVRFVSKDPLSFVRAARQFAKDPAHAIQTANNAALELENERISREQSVANENQRMIQQLDNALIEPQNPDDLIRLDVEDPMMNRLHNMNRWGTELTSMLRDLSFSGNNRDENQRNQLSNARSKATIVMYLGNDTLHQYDNAPENEKSGILRTYLSDAAENLPSVIPALQLVLDKLPKQQQARFNYILQQLAAEGISVAAETGKENVQYPEIKDLEGQAASLDQFRSNNHILSTTLPNGQTVEQGYTMYQQDSAKTNMLNNVATACFGITHALDLMADNLAGKPDSAEKIAVLKESSGILRELNTNCDRELGEFNANRISWITGGKKQVLEQIISVIGHVADTVSGFADDVVAEHQEINPLKDDHHNLEAKTDYLSKLEILRKGKEVAEKQYSDLFHTTVSQDVVDQNVQQIKEAVKQKQAEAENDVILLGGNYDNKDAKPNPEKASEQKQVQNNQDIPVVAPSNVIPQNVEPNPAKEAPEQKQAQNNQVSPPKAPIRNIPVNNSEVLEFDKNANLRNLPDVVYAKPRVDELQGALTVRNKAFAMAKELSDVAEDYFLNAEAVKKGVSTNQIMLVDEELLSAEDRALYQASKDLYATLKAYVYSTQNLRWEQDQETWDTNRYKMQVREMTYTVGKQLLSAGTKLLNFLPEERRKQFKDDLREIGTLCNAAAAKYNPNSVFKLDPIELPEVEQEIVPEIIEEEPVEEIPEEVPEIKQVEQAPVPEQAPERKDALFSKAELQQFQTWADTVVTIGKRLFDKKYDGYFNVLQNSSRQAVQYATEGIGADGNWILEQEKDLNTGFLREPKVTENKSFFISNMIEIGKKASEELAQFAEELDFGEANDEYREALRGIITFSNDCVRERNKILSKRDVKPEFPLPAAHAGDPTKEEVSIELVANLQKIRDVVSDASYNIGMMDDLIARQRKSSDEIDSLDLHGIALKNGVHITKKMNALSSNPAENNTPENKMDLLKFLHGEITPIVQGMYLYMDHAAAKEVARTDKQKNGFENCARSLATLQNKLAKQFNITAKNHNLEERLEAIEVRKPVIVENVPVKRNVERKKPVPEKTEVKERKTVEKELTAKEKAEYEKIEKRLKKIKEQEKKDLEKALKAKEKKFEDKFKSYLKEQKIDVKTLSPEELSKAKNTYKNILEIQELQQGQNGQVKYEDVTDVLSGVKKTSSARKLEQNSKDYLANKKTEPEKKDDPVAKEEDKKAEASGSPENPAPAKKPKISPFGNEIIIDDSNPFSPDYKGLDSQEKDKNKSKGFSFGFFK